MRLVNYEDVIDIVFDNYNEDLEDILDLLSALPKTDIVRCKDCKWVRKAGTLIGENPVPVYGCHNTGVYVFEDGYCDAGERKQMNVD